ELFFPKKLPAGRAAVLLAVLLCGCAERAASLPRHYRLRGGESEGQPAAFSPSSDLIKALEYLENLKQRSGSRAEPDYDQVEKLKVLLQLASQQGEAPGERPPGPGTQRQDVTAEQLMKVLLQSLQDQGEKDLKVGPASRNDRRAHRHRNKDTDTPEGGPADYGNFPQPHKKYPLMFEDEENPDASKRATEDLDEQYTPQSLANLRSIFEELGRMPAVAAPKRNVFGDDEEEEEGGFNPRNQAFENVGEEWVPGRASQDPEGADDDTKLVDYYLLKVLEMSDQTQKRDKGAEQRKRLIRPSIVDPRTVKELLQLSLKLHVPPQDLIDMLLTEELRKLHRDSQAPARYTTGQAPKIRYFSRKLPLKSKAAPEDMDREDFLDIIGVETISNEYPVVQRPPKTPIPSDRIPVASNPASPVKIPPPSGRRENLFLSELNKMPLKRQMEDEVTTYLAAKILTEYPNSVSKRDTQAQLRHQLYERALSYLQEQAEPEGPEAERGPAPAGEEKVNPTQTQGNGEVTAKTSAPDTTANTQRRGKIAAGM
uniref:Secretogranin II b n=1 Tax=Tetraodon nigroviridis TaxID=99883 RepID=H3C698_TETNG